MLKCDRLMLRQRSPQANQLPCVPYKNRQLVIIQFTPHCTHWSWFCSDILTKSDRLEWSAITYKLVG
ncbi:hypothetical protein [Nostoc sp. ChiVER01]|uniref:hypothetical protein n=1 Tax=Nostoc sp. ChiVER01 TaxID=3075382 RepID=UPI002AD309AB|nr:hypothetical protein [Nostoc sp. ChiVER01]MDZ8228305.1 hypothetical protein [Nostoc sp. ChiVER01]